MGTLPKIESVLLEINQSLGGNTGYTTVQKTNSLLEKLVSVSNLK